MKQGAKNEKAHPPETVSNCLGVVFGFPEFLTKEWNAV